MSRAAIVAVCFALGACGAHTSSRFTPYSAAAGEPAPLLGLAVVAYRGDAGVLGCAGAVIVGTLEVDGNGRADDTDIRARAIVEAAKVGGTHVLIAVERTREGWKQVREPRSGTTVVGGTAVSQTTRGDQIPVTTHSGAFIVVRVPPQRWSELPPALQPGPDQQLAGAVTGGESP